MRGIKVTRTTPAVVSSDSPKARAVCGFADLVAHTPPSGSDRWHLLADHSLAVGELAAEFAQGFGGADLARVIGYLHDAGKATDEVQRRFRELGAAHGDRRERLGVPHKVEGAMLMAALFGRDRAPLAVASYLINYGHHSGIPGRAAAATKTDVMASWRQPELTAPLAARMAAVLGCDLDQLVAAGTLPEHVASAVEAGNWSPLELFTRMCHSALVDADFIDTAAHFDGRDEPFRAKAYGMQRWLDRFNNYYDSRFRIVEPSDINRVRSEVFEACMCMAERDLPPGIYRLPAPTGTGKTLASAAFALRHAARFGKDRVIIAVPFTTITTQNAAAYRDAFGELAPSLLEHHSNIIDDDVADGTWQRLSAPGWDAEFIVTTTVQLFESLFSNRPAQTRKLHRITNSVIVLDEVQALPINLLGPILGMLRELVEHYRVTVLLASATQPSFWSMPVWNGLPVHDILGVDSLPEVTQRVTFEVRSDSQDWEAIGREVSTTSQVLLIENRRADADALFRAIAAVRGEADTFLLSKSMTADHRERVLDLVRHRLAHGFPVALVSTQLIEAGVDIDFPVVYRALGPAESVVQAAGRCNREGHLGVRGGRVVVYVPKEGGTPPGMYQVQTSIAQDRFVDHRDEWSFDSVVALREYFEDVYRSTEPQRVASESVLLRYRADLNFPQLAHDFRMITEESVDVVVLDHPDPQVRVSIARAIDGLADHPFESIPRAVRRLLQRHSASISRRDVALSHEVCPGIRVWSGNYDSKRGAVTDHALAW